MTSDDCFCLKVHFHGIKVRFVTFVLVGFIELFLFLNDLFEKYRCCIPANIDDSHIPPCVANS